MRTVKRFWEIDAIRGVAVLLMIAYHFFFDLSFFGRAVVPLNSFPLRVMQLTGASLFLLLVGVSLELRWQKHQVLRQTFIQFSNSIIYRSVAILGCAALITIVTWWLINSFTIWFGVLHLIGFSLLLSSPFFRWPKLTLPVVAVVLGAGLWLQFQTFNFKWLMWLGFRPADLMTLDYYPLLPWWGVILLGINIGRKLFSNYQRNYQALAKPNWQLLPIFEWLGRNSLTVYLLHQPILLAVLWLWELTVY